MRRGFAAVVAALVAVLVISTTSSAGAATIPVGFTDVRAKVTFEADGMVFEGTILNPVAGNRRITGTWTRGAERGTFQIRRL